MYFQSGFIQNLLIILIKEREWTEIFMYTNVNFFLTKVGKIRI